MDFGSMAEPLPLRTVIPAEFPELALLAWNRDPARPIAAAEAFALYERNWRHVDKADLGDREATLIRDLTAALGHGVMLSAR